MFCAGKSVMNVTAGVLQKLLAALNECTEWVSERERVCVCVLEREREN